MAGIEGNESPSPGGGSPPGDPRCGRADFLASPWFVCFSIAILFILATVLHFQIRIVMLEKKLEELDSSCTGEPARSLSKRSSGGAEGAKPAGVQAVHLRGVFPFQYVASEGKIGPWSLEDSEESFLCLKERNKEIKIREPGVYLVYAQVFYLTSLPDNSFQILSHNGTDDHKAHRVLAACAARGTKSMGESSCYTSFAGTFARGQRLYLNQVEQNRLIHFGGGSSFFGVVLLGRSTRSKAAAPRHG